MPRSATILISLIGFIAAAFLIFHQTNGVGEFDIGDRGLDGPLFGLAIGVVSVLVLATGLRPRHDEPGPGDSLLM
jgi:hypothetical protein